MVATGFAVISGVVSLVLIGVRRMEGLAIKLLGSLMVLALAFSAHNAFVYGIAVFIVATLVTELEFLEKLAAIVWNRKEYWQYLAKRASAEKLAAKRQAEVEEEGPDEPPPTSPPGRPAASQESNVSTDARGADAAAPTSRRTTHSSRIKGAMVQNAFQFERSAISAITNGKGPFTSPVVVAGVEIANQATKSSTIYDAIVEDGNKHYVVEVKYYERPSSLPNAAYAMTSRVAQYKAYLAERGLDAFVIPLLVVPSTMSAPDIFDGIPVLKFDDKTNDFANAESVRRILESSAKFSR